MVYDDGRAFHFNKRTNRIFISEGAAAWIRIASKIIESGEGVMEIKQGDQIVLRASPRSRQEIKAKFYEDSRGILTLTIQKFNSASGPSKEYYFSFVGDEINTLLRFILDIKRIPLKDGNKVNISDDELSRIILSSQEVHRVFSENQDIFLKFAESEVLTRDLVAVGYRRDQLKRFERLLNDPDHFEAEKLRIGQGAERVWQTFFESNKWIFGYGLSYIFLSSLDGKKT